MNQITVNLTDDEARVLYKLSQRLDLPQTEVIRWAITNSGKVEKLQQFKDYVHKRLDTMGVPHHPEGPHGKEGCRVGDRLDWVASRVGAERETIGATPVSRYSYLIELCDGHGVTGRCLRPQVDRIEWVPPDAALRFRSEGEARAYWEQYVRLPKPPKVEITEHIFDA